MKSLTIKSLWGFFAGLLGVIFGGFDKFIIGLISVMILDVITGTIKAFYNKNLNSNIIKKGVVKKSMMLLSVVTGVLFDYVIGTNVARYFIIALNFANEGLSVVENIGAFIQYPSFIKNLLEQLRDQSDSGKQ